MNDNRNYKFAVNSMIQRDEYEIITELIPEGKSVIDLGCGDGSLLKLLKQKNIKGEGIEISSSGVLSARKKGLKVSRGRIDVPLKYKDKKFDYAICNVTLQMVMYPEVLIREMKRISKKQIITFPNFAFILNRLDLLINGRMPKFMIPGYEWYSTGHIHQLSIKDFRKMCDAENLQILDEKHIFPKRVVFFSQFFLRFFPNLFASTAIFITRSRN